MHKKLLFIILIVSFFVSNILNANNTTKINTIYDISKTYKISNQITKNDLKYLEKLLETQKIKTDIKSYIEGILGYAYFYGVGVKQDFKIAKMYIEQQSKNYRGGYRPSWFFLEAQLYEHGLGGVKINKQKALKLYNKIGSNEELYPLSKYLSGMMFLQKDINSAKYYFQKAFLQSKDNVQRYRYLYEYILILLLQMEEAEDIKEIVHILYNTALVSDHYKEHRAMKLFELVFNHSNTATPSQNFFKNASDITLFQDKNSFGFQTIHKITYPISLVEKKVITYNSPINDFATLGLKKPIKDNYKAINNLEQYSKTIKNLEKKAIKNFKKIFSNQKSQEILAVNLMMGNINTINYYKDNKLHAEQILYYFSGQVFQVDKYFEGTMMDQFITDTTNYKINKLTDDINNDLDINYQDKSKKTMLMYAVSNNNYEAVKLLLENGADITLMDQNGKTALQYINSKYHTDKNTFKSVQKIYKLFRKYEKLFNKKYKYKYEYEEMLCKYEVESFGNKIYQKYCLNAVHKQKRLSSKVWYSLLGGDIDGAIQYKNSYHNPYTYMNLAIGYLIKKDYIKAKENYQLAVNYSHKYKDLEANIKNYFIIDFKIFSDLYPLDQKEFESIMENFKAKDTI